MDKKNTMLLTVIAVATLLVAVVGATFAYFSVTSNDNSSTTVETTVDPSGTITLDGHSANYSATITEALMAKENEGHKLYVSDEGGNASDNLEKTLEFATATVVGGVKGASYTCSGQITVTPSGTFTEEGAWQAQDAYIQFDEVDGITNSLGASAIDLKKGETPYTNTGNITFKLKEGTDTATLKLTGKVYVVNRAGEIQNTTGHNIAGTKLTVKVDLTGISCQKDSGE